MQKILTNKQWVVLFFFVIPSIALFSQGLIESPLSYNPVLAGKKRIAVSNFSFRSSSIADTISLGSKGIFEDFSYLSPYPDSSIWLDSAVFVNRGYAISPPSIGVATFDGLDATGYPYNFFAPPNISAPADTLTSKPIDLNYPAVDSIYLSFYCQPQGIGNDPQQVDSLVLEFKSPDTASSWRHIWASEGYALTDSVWRHIMIPIVDASFLKKGFQFRFRNYATTNGNYDQWNIDDVYLNRIRTINDTVLPDISWVYNGSSLLKDYTAMPWRQYTPSELITSVTNLIRNNDSVLRNVTYNYETKNVTTSTVLDLFNGTSNINPFTLNKIYTDCDFNLGCISSAAIATSTFPASLSGSTTLQIQHYFSSGLLGDVSPRNDTLTVVNEFSNYFAYDDGTAETAVGINRLNARLAQQFTLKVSDSLSAVDIYFNPLETNAELYAFYLNVWSDVGGKPGIIPIYTATKALSPEYPRAGQNVFTRYYLEDPIFLQAGTYYIGFTQKTDKLLNVGLDKNNNTQNRIYFNVISNWEISTIKGSLMMRPITGYVDDPTGMEKYANEVHETVVFPNPVSDKLQLKTTEDNTSYVIMDVFGSAVLQGIYTPSSYIDVSMLSSGIYFISTPTSVNKFIKID
jgi:hypothetical protein